MKTITMAAAALLLAVTAGCGEDDETPAPAGEAASSESGGTSEAGDDDPDGGYPPCSEVWVDGQSLPEDYGGCTNDDGSLAGSSFEECTDGSRIYTHDSSFFTQPDGTIVATEVDELLDDPAFEQRSADCSARF